MVMRRGEFWLSDLVSALLPRPSLILCVAQPGRLYFPWIWVEVPGLSGLQLLAYRVENSTGSRGYLCTFEPGGAGASSKIRC